MAVAVPVPGEIVLAIDDYSSRMPHGISDDDHVLRLALDARGHSVRPTVWGGDVEPGTTVLIRSTWDYVDHLDRFRAWLERLDEQGVVVHNPTSTIRGNLHKRYLTDLAARGVRVVPTRLLAQGSTVTLDGVATATGWDDVVVKPAIGSTARLTVHQSREGRGATATHLANLLELIEPNLFLDLAPDSAEFLADALVALLTGQASAAPRPGD